MGGHSSVPEKVPFVVSNGLGTTANESYSSFSTIPSGGDHQEMEVTEIVSQRNAGDGFDTQLLLSEEKVGWDLAPHRSSVDVGKHWVSSSMSPADRERQLRNSRPKIFKATPEPFVGPSFLSGAVCAILYLVFCNAFASAVFSDNLALRPYVPLGVQVYIGSAIISQILSLIITGHVGLPGPEINAVIVHTHIAHSVCRLNQQLPEQILPTVLFAISLATLTVGLSFILLGWFKLAQAVQFLPALVLHGFLACIGIEVIRMSLGQATGQPVSEMPWDAWLEWDTLQYLCPIFAIAVPLFISRRYHIGKIGHVLPLFFSIPLAVFYATLWFSDTDIEESRDHGWMFPSVQQQSFWKLWSAVDIRLVNFKTIAHLWDNILMLVLIESIDFLLKLAGTEKSLGIEIDFDKEFLVAGWSNVLGSMVCAAPGYHQTKFAVINYNIVNSVASRLPVAFSCTILGVIYFLGHPILNYLPRFLLAGILFFVGLSFIAENMFDPWKSMNPKECMAIWLICLTNLLYDLLHAVALGLVLAVCLFAMRYAAVSCIKSICTGADQRGILRPPEEEKKLEHLSGRQIMIIRFQGLIFFGSASAIQAAAEDCLHRLTVDILSPARLRYLICDFEGVADIDVAATGVFGKILRLAYRSKVSVLWTGMSSKIYQKLAHSTGLITEAACFTDLDLAIEFVENLLLDFSKACRQLWLLTEGTRYLNSVWRIHAALAWVYNINDKQLTVLDRLSPYCTFRQFHAGEVVCQAGQVHDTLYYIQQGRACAFADTDGGRPKRVMILLRGTYINEEGFWLGSSCPYTYVITKPSIMVCISRDYYNQLVKLDPTAALQVPCSILTHMMVAKNKLSRHLNTFHSNDASTGLPKVSNAFKNKQESQQQHLKTMFQGRSASHMKFESAVKFASYNMKFSPITSFEIPESPSTKTYLPPLSESEVGKYNSLFDLYEQNKLTRDEHLQLGYAVNMAMQYQRREEASKDWLSDQFVDDGKWECTNEGCETENNTLQPLCVTCRQHKPFTREEFLSCAQKTLLAPLQYDMVKKLENIFAQFASEAPGGDSPSSRASSRGRMRMHDLREMMCTSGNIIDEQELQMLLMDFDGSRDDPKDIALTTSNFVVAVSKLVQKKRLSAHMHQAFQSFLVSPHANCIDLHGLIQGLRRIGADYTYSQITEMLWEASSDGSGTISLDDFMAVMEW